MDIWERFDLHEKLIKETQLKLGKKEVPNEILEQKVDSLSRKVDQLAFRVLRREVPSMAFKQLMERHILKVLKAEGFYVSRDEDDPVTKATGVAYRDELLRSIINAVEKRWHSGIVNKSRKKNASLARHVACYLMREMSPLSYPEIGIVLDRDHTTIMHGYFRVKERVDADPEFAQEILEMRQRIEDHMRTEQLKERGEKKNGVSGKVDMLANGTRPHESSGGA